MLKPDLAERYQFVHGDIGNYQLTRHLFETHKPDVVVNFAAESHNSYAITNPGIFFETNVAGYPTFIAGCTGCQGGRVFIIFQPVKSMAIWHSIRQRKFKEGDPFHARTPYNAAKAGSDLAVRAYFETFKLPVTISKLFQ